jgi:hypothetical protein
MILTACPVYVTWPPLCCVTLVWAAAKMSATFEKPAWQLEKPSGQQLRPRSAPYQVGWGSTNIQVGRLQAKLPITGFKQIFLTIRFCIFLDFLYDCFE